ncbi:hypothetical protein P3W85_29770 [Cupriavidus basilensis]|uniref:Uncharacterized protein n=1 Tax=Cupriavidus basilensis TaxID=68895 RepID=A0ABT6AWV0_9BURK|nr:hypothetical protein [Cupriavidus basilensis]MDF3837111.1 hypothetical protein [Cupriavidus basilensis]
MKLSERILARFDAEAAEERSVIADRAADVDTLGELISTAYYDGVSCRPEDIHVSGSGGLMVPPSGDRVAAIAWMLSHGFTADSTIASPSYTHHLLRHPRLATVVAILVPSPEAA